MDLSTLSQLIYEEVIRCHLHQGAEIDQNYLNILMLLRTILIQNGDPLIHMTVGNTELLMSLSHLMPLFRAVYPLYDTALPRIAKMICVHQQYLKVIDIGANIGDTVASISQEAVGSFLCIEGNRHYFSILQENVRSLNAHVICVKAICGESDCLVQGYMKSEHGTGHLVVEAVGETIQLTSLNTILDNNECFKDANLLKVDTDGFDTCILRGAQQFLADTGPTVFFEYVPALISNNSEHPLSIFSYLAALGYQCALFYTNLGFPLEIVDISHQQQLAEMLDRIDHTNIAYYDVLLPGRNLPYEAFIAFYQHEHDIVQKILSPS